MKTSLHEKEGDKLLRKKGVKGTQHTWKGCDGGSVKECDGESEKACGVASGCGVRRERGGQQGTEMWGNERRFALVFFSGWPGKHTSRS